MSDDITEASWGDIAAVLAARNGNPLALVQSTLQAGEGLPPRVTASMWVEAKGRTPDAALIGLHREVDRWHLEEGWSLADGKISVVRWEGEYQAEAVLTRTVTW